jgi:hypothetical protein
MSYIHLRQKSRAHQEIAGSNNCCMNVPTLHVFYPPPFPSGGRWLYRLLISPRCFCLAHISQIAFAPCLKLLCLIVRTGLPSYPNDLLSLATSGF